MEFARDLASADLWAQSLERSLARRGRPRRASIALGRLTEERDLADPEHLSDSAAYWRTRRAADAATSLPAPAVGGASVLALLAATTIPSLAAGSSSSSRRGSIHRSVSGSGAPAAVGAKRRSVRAQGAGSTAGTSGTHYVLASATVTQTETARTHVLSASAPSASVETSAASAETHVLSATVESPAAQKTHVLSSGTTGGATAAAPAQTAQAATTAAPAHHAVYGKVTFGDLRDAQRMLGVSIDDVLGPKTGAAIRAFQASHGLAVDGVIGPATWNALKDAEHTVARAAHASSIAVTHTIVAGVRQAAQTSSPDATDVMALQEKLGLSPDGTFGAETVAAVQAFQSAHGLTPDGVVGPDTRIALGLSSGPTLQPPLATGAAGDGATTTASTDSPAATTTTAPTTTASTTTVTTAATSTATSDASSSSTTPANVQLALSEMIAAANQIATLPYIWGGGHGSWVSPGYDCSGSVSFVLHAAGLLSVPEDSSTLESYGAPGPGQYVTIYANAGHAWMTINGQRFDTVSLSENGSRWSSGGGEFAGFVVRHPVGF